MNESRKLRDMLANGVKVNQDHRKDPYVRLTFDPWQNESIEYDISGDEDLALEALGLDIDVYQFMDTLVKRGVTVEKYQIYHQRHTGTRWRVCATFTPEEWRRFAMWKHPYITVEHYPWKQRS
jgi:hypothetical protein